MKVFWSIGYPSVGWSLSELYKKVGVRPEVGGGATLIGMPYHWANVPRSGCRFAFCVMLPIHVALCALTGKVEMSALKTLSLGKRGHVVPGSGSAITVGAVGRHNPKARITAAAKRSGEYLTIGLTKDRAHDCARVAMLGRYVRPLAKDKRANHSASQRGEGLGLGV